MCVCETMMHARLLHRFRLAIEQCKLFNMHEYSGFLIGFN
jgi:hypothetical protein